jgi:hypothetical protein
MFSKTLNTLVVALAAVNAATVIAAPEPVITGAPLEKREAALEERQCEYRSFSRLLGYSFQDQRRFV